MATTTAFQACTLGNCNILVDADNFLQLDYVRTVGPIRFKLEWQAGDQIRSVEWTQAQNPLAATDQDQCFISLRAGQKFHWTGPTWSKDPPARGDFGRKYSHAGPTPKISLMQNGPQISGKHSKLLTNPQS